MISSGATPLGALDAVALDTETTGLDATTARIVQIGAVAVRRGAVDAAATLEALVNPRVPIPATSTGVHRITDAMVRDALSFADAWRAFCVFTAGRVLIGYSIGFDFAVISREASRVGLDWRKPRSLCVRLLATAANRHLPDPSLETIASWLGVAVSSRHTALGDARAAADIFVALLPHLAKRGINTLAEAELACLDLTDQLQSHRRAGWMEPISRPDRLRSFVAVDPYAYRHRLSELMSRPPVVASAATAVRDAMGLMLVHGISSIFVSERGLPGEQIEAYGIVTERDLMRHLAAGSESAFAEPVGTLQSRPLVAIRASAFAYRAIGRMARLGIRHLAVTDEEGCLAGIISARDLLDLRASAAINLDDAIEAASSTADLAAAWTAIPGVAQSLVAEDVEAPLVAEIVSEELRALTRRAALLAEREMSAAGNGQAPCAYAVLVLGSGGRGESLLAADQDNAIVYAEGAQDGAGDRWFAELGEKIATILGGSGIPLCKGGVMAKNAAWRGSLDAWKERVGEWVRRSRPEDLLNVDIFYDMQAVHGDHRLAIALRDFAFESAREEVVFAKALGERAAAPVNPFSLLGGFRLEHGRIDLKRYGLFPVVAFARALAIRHDVRTQSTRDRLAGLSALGVGPEAEFRRLAGAHACMLKHLLRQQSRDLLSGIAVSNRVETATLSRDEQEELRSALETIGLVPDMVRAMIFR